jgi:hypothetical protein
MGRSSTTDKAHFQKQNIDQDEENTDLSSPDYPYEEQDDMSVSTSKSSKSNGDINDQDDVSNTSGQGVNQSAVEPITHAQLTIEELAHHYQEEMDRVVEITPELPKTITELRSRKKKLGDKIVRMSNQTRAKLPQSQAGQTYAMSATPTSTTTISPGEKEDVDITPPPDIPLFSEFVNGIEKEWEESLVTVIAIEDWGSANSLDDELSKNNFWSVLIEIVERHKEDLHTSMGEKITVYNHHAIVSEFKAMGLDICNLPTKITFVCTRVLFCYTFAGARYRPHGMITVIAARLLEQFFNAMKVSVHWIRGHQPELPLMGSNLPQTFLNPESAEFKRIFSSMRLEPRRLYTLLKKRMKYDNGRKAYIWHGGWSTQDHKRKEEWTAANEPCSTPKLNGEKDDDVYKQLGSVADCIQDYLDLYCRVEGRAPNNDPARYDVFGKKLQKKCVHKDGG